MRRYIAFCLAFMLLAGVSTVTAGSLNPFDKRQAPAMELVDMDGLVHSLSSYKGKVVVVNFWATWCPPCLKELPSMQSLWERYRDQDLMMLGVNVGEDHDSIFRFTGTFETELDFPILLDERMNVVRGWPVVGLPTTFIVDKSGRIVLSAVGERDWVSNHVIASIERLLDE